MFRDRREPILAELARLREQRLDADPEDHERLTLLIDEQLERLSEMSR